MPSPPMQYTNKCESSSTHDKRVRVIWGSIMLPCDYQVNYNMWSLDHTPPNISATNNRHSHVLGRHDQFQHAANTC